MAGTGSGGGSWGQSEYAGLWLIGLPDGWTDGLIGLPDGRTDGLIGRMDGWMDGWMDGLIS